VTLVVRYTKHLRRVVVENHSHETWLHHVRVAHKSPHVFRPMIAAARAHAGVPAAAALRARAPRRARSLIARAVDPESSGKSYYKVVNGVKLDRKVVDDCVAFEKNDGKIDMAEAERVFNDIVDGPKRRVGGANETDTTVTNVELDTMQYCFDTFQWEDDAKEWFYEKLTSENW